MRRRNVRKPIVLTAGNDSLGHLRVAHVLAVDDFLVKPVSAAEIEAHIDAILRPAAKSAVTNRVWVGDLEIYKGSPTVIRSGRHVTLSSAQRLLLWALADRADTVVSREALHAMIWKYRETTPTTLTSLVTSLRQRLSVAGERDPIKTVRGGGYMLRSDA